MKHSSPKGRGSGIQPPNRFESVAAEADFEHVAEDEEYLAGLGSVRTEYLPDESRSIISENDSPDLPFRYSLNPYRGCQHGCAYCYARPTHEYLGLSAGLDFESKIFVKHRAAELFREWLRRPRYQPETVTLSGVTDCYQPGEREFRITRSCLEVALEARQPVTIVTKNALVTRDLDLLREMAVMSLVAVAVSVTTLDAGLARVLEPRTSSPEARLNALRSLSDAGIPTRVMTAPIIPGLNDSELPAVLQAAADAGARSAGYILLRLPLAVRPIFEEWLSRNAPSKASRVESLIRSTREGQMNDSRFGSRFRGTGQIAEQIRRTFQVFSRKYGLDGAGQPLDVSRFRRPRAVEGQLELF
ncbi:MAG: radical SAM protein [Planctomycetota bacterium]|nr:MAG: radical SAM protein [Planctomycetota bacterium]